jgi:hypothetical protein
MTEPDPPVNRPASLRRRLLGAGLLRHRHDGQACHQRVVALVVINERPRLADHRAASQSQSVLITPGLTGRGQQPPAGDRGRELPRRPGAHQHQRAEPAPRRRGRHTDRGHRISER